MTQRRVILVEYFTDGDSVLVFGVRADWPEPEVVEQTFRQDELRRFVTANFGSNNRVNDLSERALKALWHRYDRLVAPVADWADRDDIVCLVPHGLLHYLPLHALRLGGQYLIERNPVVYAPSATVLKYCQAKRTPRPGSTPARWTAAVFGDPEGDLPDSRPEAEDIARLFRTSPRFGGDVTPENFRRAAAGVDLVHFCGHSEFDSDRPLESGLRMAGGRRLTAREVFDLEGLDADLVTLSSCESGVSENRPGDELLGLTRAFLYAGTPTLLVSLWRVPDPSSAFLMRRFYSELCGDPTPLKVDALQRAVLATRDQPGWSSLYFWAPFILVGDWR